MEDIIPAALFLLERAVAEFFQFLPDCLIQLRKGEELFIAQPSGDPCGDITNAAFCQALILRVPDAGRDDSGSIMFCHLLINGVDPLILPALVVVNSGAAVVRYEDSGYSAKVFVYVDVGRITCPVNFNLFLRLAVDVHRGAAFLLILLDVITELGIHEWIIASPFTACQILCLQEFLIDPVAEGFLTDVFVVRHPLVGDSGSIRFLLKQHFRQYIVCQIRIQGSCKVFRLGCLERLVDRRLGNITTECDV